METYKNGPEGMPRVERLSDSTIDWATRQVSGSALVINERSYSQLRDFAHAIAEEVLARIPAPSVSQPVGAVVAELPELPQPLANVDAWVPRDYGRNLGSEELEANGEYFSAEQMREYALASQPAKPADVGGVVGKFRVFYFSKQRNEMLPDPKRVSDPLYYLAEEVDAALAAQTAAPGMKPAGYVVRHDNKGGNFFSVMGGYEGMRRTYGESCQLVYTAAPAPAAPVDLDSLDRYEPRFKDGYMALDNEFGSWLVESDVRALLATRGT